MAGAFSVMEGLAAWAVSVFVARSTMLDSAGTVTVIFLSAPLRTVPDPPYSVRKSMPHGLGGQLDGLRRGAVVRGDDVLVAALGVRTGEGVDGALGIALGLDAVAQRRVLRGQLGERGDGPVERVARVVRVQGVRAVRAQLVVVEVVRGLRGEHRLAGVLVAMRRR